MSALINISSVDIYIACVSSAHNVCAKGYYVAIISTIVEGSVPEREVEAAIALLGPIVEKYVPFNSLVFLFVGLLKG